MISHIIIRSYPLHNEYSSFFPIISYFVGNSSTNFMTFLPIVVISSQIGLRVMVLWFTCAFRSNRSNQIQALIPGTMLCMCAGNSSSRQHKKKHSSLWFDRFETCSINVWNDGARCIWIKFWPLYTVPMLRRTTFRENRIEAHTRKWWKWTNIPGPKMKETANCYSVLHSLLKSKAIFKPMDAIVSFLQFFFSGCFHMHRWCCFFIKLFIFSIAKS